MVLPNDVDLLNPSVEHEKRKHKLKRLVQSPNSFFMVKTNLQCVEGYASSTSLELAQLKGPGLVLGHKLEPLARLELAQLKGPGLVLGHKLEPLASL
ncbi:hypothetical protein RND71_007243 [Anisodus tanguticus]|uniref:Uncharacterized protein n=1 Tax=Anisodus tanguticus TaxID=243964 RepID=A0AAE1VSX3_9SOLA|nr:hypothetical protein RND71_007243 [Anisodus tanguticus]